jgi:hypothetical protein
MFIVQDGQNITGGNEMSLTSIGWSNLAQSLSSLNVSQVNGISSSATSNTSPQVNSADSTSSDSGASVSISSGGQMMSKLQQLQSQDPAKFKQLMTDVSNQLQSAASNSTGADQKFLSSMANKFAQAANGDLSALQPQQQQSANNAISAYTQSAQNGSNALSALTTHGSHGHHHGGGGGKGGSSVQQAMSNVFDELNQALSSNSTSASTSSAGSSAISSSFAAAQ